MKQYVEELNKLVSSVAENQSFLEKVEEATSLIHTSMKSGNKIMVAGNGGSAADAQHFVAEFVGRYKMEREGYPAISLTTDTSILTAWSNDYDFSTVFSRQIESLGKEGDVFLGISTSGNSENILKATDEAKKRNIKTVALLGNDGGKMKGRADVSIIVPSENTPRIQEVHTLVLHMIAEEVEKKLSN